MADHKLERFNQASPEQMTLGHDNRVFYVPDTASKNIIGVWVAAIGIALLAALVLVVFFHANRTPKASSTEPGLEAFVVKAKVPQSAVQAPVATISEPPVQWMSAYSAILDSASLPDAVIPASLWQALDRLNTGRSQITAQQQKIMGEHNKKGLDAIKSNQFAVAAEEFLAAFQIDASNPEVAENLGYALYKNGQIELATRALLRSLMTAPQRSTAWGNLGGAYALAGKRGQSTAAFALSLRLAKQPSRARNNLIKTYQEDPSESVRTASAEALSNQYASLVEPILREHLGNLSKFPFSVLLPAKIASTDSAGSAGSVYVLNNAEFPVKVESTDYAIWLGSEKNCQMQACIVGLISGSKSMGQSAAESAVVDLAGGVKGTLGQADDKHPAWLTVTRDGVTHRFSLGSETQVTAMANSALSLGAMPAGVFANRPTSSQTPAVGLPLEASKQATSPEKPSTILGMLSTSPRGPPLSSEQIYERASASVVVVRTSDLQGSGVVISPEIVVTNCHVTKQGDATVEFRKTRFRAIAIAGSAEMDYCILKVVGLPAKPAPMGPLTDVATGQRVYSLGSPRGWELTFAEGLVSALRRDASLPLNVIQTTAAISPGSSGGGLFDAFGRVIGITTLYRSDAQNLNFAVPVELYKYLGQNLAPQPYQPPPAKAPAYSPPITSECNIYFKIELQTFGENVNVELRAGTPGSSKPSSSRQSAGGQVSFSNLCPGSYFLAIGNDDYVRVTPVMSFEEGGSYTSRITTQRGSGNMSRQSKKTL